MRDIIVALSGGVDSGAAASLALENGDRVRGLYMRHRYQETLSAEQTRAVLNEVDRSRVFFCFIDDGRVVTLEAENADPGFLLPVDAASAIRLASQLGIDLFILDVDPCFSKIVDNFVEEYYLAHTPNPCALCNKRVKFGVLYDVARQLGADLFATGHYVRKMRIDKWSRLGGERATNETPHWLTTNAEDELFVRSPSQKDQTYFLYNVDRKILPNVVFPIGEMRKEDVRNYAESKGLVVAARKDSQEVCFVPDKQRLEFIRDLRKQDPERWSRFPEDSSGDFVSIDGRKIGRHNGYEKYTVGQRKGLGMGFGERIFVQSVDAQSRRVVLGPYDALATTSIKGVDANWFVDVPIGEDFRCEIKIRYRNESCAATVRVDNDGSVLAIPDSPRFGVAPGQAMVCYYQDALLGGARIV